VSFVNAAKRTLLCIGAGLCVGACASTPTTVEIPPPPAPSQQAVVYAYPLRNQTAEQQDRDRYECHLWAVKQSGFDPSAPSLPQRARIRIVNTPPSSVPGAAVTGAVLGALVGSPYQSGAGAAVGAVAGAMVGAASDAQRDQRIQQAEQQRNQALSSRASAIGRKVDDYRRAISACFAGRGYSTQ
jgi:hypothetical protein